jgi:hypothetical protein
VNQKSIVANVLAKAKTYRDLTRMIDDRETAQRILELTEEVGRLLWPYRTRTTSEYVHGRSGKKMGDYTVGIRSFGFRLNGNFVKLKTSPFTRSKRLEPHSGNQCHSISELEVAVCKSS